MCPIIVDWWVQVCFAVVGEDGPGGGDEKERIVAVMGERMMLGVRRG
jgi:hypothetical protein